MTTSATWSIHIQSEPITEAQRDAFTHDESCGADVSFKGMVRTVNQGKAVTHIVYSCYEELAKHELEQLAASICQEFPVTKLTILHRVGHVGIGECSVWIAVQSKHRDEAFLACRATIDRLKHSIPIWKQEFYVDNSHAWSRCTASHGAGEHAEQGTHSRHSH